MIRRHQMLAGVLAVSAIAALVVAATVDAPDRDVITAQQAPPSTGCAAPTAQTPDAVADPKSPKPADVTVTGSQSVDTRGLSAGSVATAGGASWVVVRDSAATSTVGRVGRIDGNTISSIIDVVTGCEVTALAASDAALWAGTCAPVGAASGAELVRIDPASGAVQQRVALNAGCVTDLAATTDHVVATITGDVDSPARFASVDAGGNVSEPITLERSEAVLGMALDDHAAWMSVRGPAGSRLVHIATGTEPDAVPIDAPTRVLGFANGALWTQDLVANTLSARDVETGAVTATIAVPDLVTATASESGVWYQTASTNSLTVTIGVIDATNAPRVVTTYNGKGPDRTGLPFTGVLSATSTGAWLAIQDRLFLVAL